MAVLWSHKDTYGSGLSGGSIYESEFENFGLSEMQSQFEEWGQQIEGYNEIIAEGDLDIDPIELVGWEGSEYEERQDSLLTELGETYKSMSIDVLTQQKKGTMAQKKLSSQFGRAGLAGSGGFEREVEKSKARHSKSIWDTYSDFLSAKAGITSSISSAREDWWTWNQGLITDAAESAAG